MAHERLMFDSATITGKNPRWLCLSVTLPHHSVLQVSLRNLTLRDFFCSRVVPFVLRECCAAFNLLQVASRKRQCGCVCCRIAAAGSHNCAFVHVSFVCSCLHELHVMIMIINTMLLFVLLHRCFSSCFRWHWEMPEWQLEAPASWTSDELAWKLVIQLWKLACKFS